MTGRKYRKLVEKAQEASESSGRTSRRQTLEFAESMNIQREMIYAQRDRLIYHNQGLDTVIDEVLDDFIDQAMAEEDFSKAENLYHFILRNISSASMKFLRIWTSTIVRKSWNSSTSLPIVNLMLRSRS